MCVSAPWGEIARGHFHVAEGNGCPGCVVLGFSTSQVGDGGSQQLLSLCMLVTMACHHDRCWSVQTRHWTRFWMTVSA